MIETFILSQHRNGEFINFGQNVAFMYQIWMKKDDSDSELYDLRNSDCELDKSPVCILVAANPVEPKKLINGVNQQVQPYKLISQNLKSAQAK